MLKKKKNIIIVEKKGFPKIVIDTKKTVDEITRQLAKNGIYPISISNPRMKDLNCGSSYTFKCEKPNLD